MSPRLRVRRPRRGAVGRVALVLLAAAAVAAWALMGEYLPLRQSEPVAETYADLLDARELRADVRGEPAPPSVLEQYAE